MIRLLNDTALRRAGSVTALVSIDACCLVAGILIASSVAKGPWSLLWPHLAWWAVAMQVAALVCIVAAKGLYGRRLARRNSRKTLSAWVIAFIVTLVLSILLDQDAIGARYVAAWMVGVTLDLGGRAVYDALTGLLPNRDRGPAALLLGTPASCQTGLVAVRALPPGARVDVRGLLLTGDSRPSDASDPLPEVLGTVTDLAQVLTATGATQVIISEPGELNGRMRSVMDLCSARGVALNVIVPGIPATEPVAYIPGLDCPLFVVVPHPAGAASYLAKSILDRIVAAALLLALSPVLAAIAIAVKLTSTGPAFFTDERVGVGQRTFRCYKFRTMVRDARENQARLEERNEAGGVLFKLQDDPRVTPVGRFLRRTSLDELPQLWNVLRGDMSLVGPRPLPLRDCGLMEDSHRRRHVMKPGITGLWQVSGRSDLGFDDMVRLDLQYMGSWSLKSDAYIMWRTLGAVVRARGAY
jgi:exopolysaccharide biosynthesis polyprenyl glycosylphosphotransferase